MSGKSSKAKRSVAAKAISPRKATKPKRYEEEDEEMSEFSDEYGIELEEEEDDDLPIESDEDSLIEA